MEAQAEVRMAVNDVFGREVAVLADGTHEAGRHSPTLDDSALPAGAYAVRATLAGDRRVTVRSRYPYGSTLNRWNRKGIVSDLRLRTICVALAVIAVRGRRRRRWGRSRLR